MSCDKWKYTEKCDGEPCCGDCDCCSKETEEPMICDDCFHNNVCRLDGNEMLEWCSARVPSADVVEVVRCRDCKHLAGWDESHPHDFIYICGRRILENRVLLDDFCSYGERKESKEKKCFDIPKDLVERWLND